MSSKLVAAATVGWLSRRQATLLFSGPLCLLLEGVSHSPGVLSHSINPSWNCPLWMHPETGLLVDSRSLRVDKINFTYPPSHAWLVGVAWGHYLKFALLETL